MKHKTLVILALPVVILAASCGGGKKKAETGSVDLKTPKDSASYAAGLNEGERLLEMLKQSGVDTILNQEIFLQGFNDYMGKKGKMGKELSQKVLRRFFTNLREKEMAKIKQQNGPLMEAAKKWMEENGKNPGVTTTTSGLQYEVLKKGSGPMVKIGDMVSVHYEGTLTNGEKFDSSYDGGQPYQFQLAAVGGVIQGWVEALQLMNKGTKLKVYIPYELGYGEMGDGRVIPPCSNLVFTMELVDHTPAK